MLDFGCDLYLCGLVSHVVWLDCCVGIIWLLSLLQCVTLTFAERFRLAVSLSGNKPLSAN